jgi:Tfp pilus assembly protein PilX
MIKISDMKVLRGIRTSGRDPSQHGMASIIITMVTMVVISLIVLGFATISRREARQSLDQLQSTQAFYAAESGIEDARKVIRNWLDNPATAALPVPSKANCTTNDPTSPSAYPTGGDMMIDAANNIGYTCLQVDPAPESVEFDGIDSDSTVIPLTSTTGGIRRVEITWQANTPLASLANCPGDVDHEFRPQSGANAWRCEYGVMRVDLTPTNGVLTRAGLSGSTYSGFFQPVNFLAGGSDNYTNVNQARLVAARCTVTSCRATIDQIPNLTSVSLRLSSLYQPSDVRIVAFNSTGVGGSPLRLSGVQAEVDVTGKASDVLRRIKVRIPLLSNGTLVPGYAITSNGSICKRFSTGPSFFSIPNDIIDPDNSNDMCTAVTFAPPASPVAAVGCPINSDIILVMDTSHSMTKAWGSSTRLDTLRTVAGQFVAAAGVGATRNHVGLIKFGGSAQQMTTGFSASTANLQSIINGLTDYTDYRTNYITAMQSAEGMFTSGRSGVRKIMIFISDGRPNDLGEGTEDNPANAVNAIAKATQMKTTGQVVIYTIGIVGDDLPEPNALAEMDGFSPGQYFSSVNPADIQNAAQVIAQEARCD